MGGSLLGNHVNGHVTLTLSALGPSLIVIILLLRSKTDPRTERIKKKKWLKTHNIGIHVLK